MVIITVIGLVNIRAIIVAVHKEIGIAVCGIVSFVVGHMMARISVVELTAVVGGGYRKVVVGKAIIKIMNIRADVSGGGF